MIKVRKIDVTVPARFVYAVLIYLDMFYFSTRYFVYTCLLLLTEILIGMFMHDRFIRPYAGDFLVVILLYCFVKTFLNISVWKAAISVLLFSYLIEILQYFKIVEVIGLQKSSIARIVIGNSFSWEDLIAYTAGILLVLYFERKKITGSDLPIRTGKQ